jgi:hypothetical protein
MKTMISNSRNYGIAESDVQKGRKKHWNNERRYKIMH